VVPIDALDGALARATGRKSRFGAFLDSTLDRVSDAAVILGLTAHYLRREAYVPVALLLVSLVASLLVSYVRARAEDAGVHVQGRRADAREAPVPHRGAVGARVCRHNGVGLGGALCSLYCSVSCTCMRFLGEMSRTTIELPQTRGAITTMAQGGAT
jgi:hypothetical protein